MSSRTLQRGSAGALTAVAFVIAGPLAARAAPSEAAARPALSIRVEAERGGLRFGLAPGGRLRSGDRLRATLSADLDVFVNVVQFFGDGSAALLYPVDESGFLAAASELHVPRAGYWLELDDSVGEEHLYFVVSTRPLADIDRVIAESIERVRSSAGGRVAAGTRTRVAAVAGESPGTGRAPGAPEPRMPETRTPPATLPGAPATPSAPVAVPPAPAPSGSDLRNRGLVRVAGPDGTVVEFDADGFAIHRFSFFHDPG